MPAAKNDYSLFCTSTAQALNDALDADPLNHTLRSILSDAMRDADDPRADGMLALARCGRSSIMDRYDLMPCWTLIGRYRSPQGGSELIRAFYKLPRLWHSLITPHYPVGLIIQTKTINFPTRRAADEAAAEAFLGLSKDMQSQYIRGKLRGVPDHPIHLEPNDQEPPF